MLALSVIWLALGLLLGALAAAAGLTPARWLRWRWLATPALGAVAALAGGWLGAQLFDRVFASFVALWVGLAVIASVSLLLRRQFASRAPLPTGDRSGETIPAAPHVHDSP